jgi:hypothetical protein
MKNNKELVEAHIRLQCADKDHKKHKTMCTNLKTAIVDNFNDIDWAGTIESYGAEADYCVLASARITRNNRLKFERDLKNFHSKTNKAKVKAVDVMIIKKR